MKVTDDMLDAYAHDVLIPSLDAIADRRPPADGAKFRRTAAAAAVLQRRLNVDAAVAFRVAAEIVEKVRR